MPTTQSTPHLQRRRSSRAAPGEKFDDYIIRRKAEIEQQHERISIYKSPLLVSSYFIMFAYYEARATISFLCSKGRVTVGLLATLAGMIYIAYQVQGPHQQFIHELGRIALWYGYWVLLGIASAFGLGTGLHTFLLFLGPYIAEVTRDAYQCQGADFLVRDPISYRLNCPGDMSVSATMATTAAVSLWDIFAKVRWESFAWGAGTALGELPPYFVARAVALSGGKSEELADFEAGLEKSSEQRTFKEQLTYWVYHGMKRLGFFGILFFASIPNPLFDLAGIICGNFLVPFATFFGATFLGKACIKASLQSLVVILAFSNDTLSVFLSTLQNKAPALHVIVERIIHEQAHKIGKGEDDFGQEQTNIFGIAWNVFLSLMVCYFVVSSIESLGLAYMKREHQEEMKRLEQRRQNKPTRKSDKKQSSPS
ncbi:transmembrane protein 49-like protein [Lichtheimia hyalospora FSU 10163]|nr:transmembrane protein 49-like protein [Lichtheimia hyalospora FSU 10163]